MGVRDGAVLAFGREAWAAIEPHLPKNQPGSRRVDDRLVISGILHVLKVGCRLCDCSADYRSSTTVYNRFNRWSQRGFWLKLLDTMVETGAVSQSTAMTGIVEEIRRVDCELKALSIASPARLALMSIPGVGVQTSAAFAAVVDEAGRLKRSRTVGAYFGLVPRWHQSYELDWTGRITKQGDGTVRKRLYEAANSTLTSTRQTFPLKTWALKIAKRRGLKNPGRACPPHRCPHARHAA